MPDKKSIPEELTVTVEKLSNLGYGIARVEGYVIFVENACPGDILKIKVGKKNKSYAHAKILEILVPSKYRVQPFCPLQKVCGACQLQHIDYGYQLNLKREIVVDTIKSIYGSELLVKDVIPSPKNREYRHKIQYPVSETKSSGRILAGYYKQESHDIVNIKYCPVQPEYCDKIIDFIRNYAKDCGVKGYIEKNSSGDLKHVVIRTSDYTKQNLVTLVVNSPKLLENVKKLAHKIYTELENIQGVCVNYNPKKTNLILSDNTEVVEGEGFIEEKLCDKVFKIGADTFFQVNPYTAENIFNFVKKYITENSENPLILDAYAGISSFGICLSDVSKKVVCVESVKSSVVLADKIIKENQIKNVELHNMDVSKFFEKELTTKGRRFDYTILDPPRKGCSEESLEYALILTKDKIIYVSCNPATLARDLKYLTSKGCKVEFIQPFDMFCHTYHIENVAVIKLPVK